MTVKRKFHIFDLLNYLILSLLALTMLYPFWEQFVVSVSLPADAMRAGFKFYPRSVTFDAYRQVFQSVQIRYGYVNTILRTLIGTAASVFMCFMTAYPLSQKKLPCRNLFTIYFLIPMFFSGGLIPNYLLVNQLSIFDTIWALLLPVLFSTYNLLIMRNFIMTLPDSLQESALIDGAGFFVIMIRIIIPLSLPVLATIALWVAVMHWNSWFDAMLYTRSMDKTVLQLVLRRMIIDSQELDSSGTEIGSVMLTESVQAATILITVGPVILVYPFLQRFFVKGVIVGSLKG